MLFKEWLLSHREEDSALGDFVRDIVCDPDFPDTDDPRRIRSYLNRIHARDEAFDLLAQAREDFTSAGRPEGK